MNNKLLNIINYNEYTHNIKHWKPYEEFININDLINKKQQLYILGPSNIDNLKYHEITIEKIIDESMLKLNKLLHDIYDDILDKLLMIYIIVL